MYISENDLKSRILTGQIEVLDDFLNEVRRKREVALFKRESQAVIVLRSLEVLYSQYHTTLTRDREKLKQEK